jgi:hypothetical protein
LSSAVAYAVLSGKWIERSRCAEDSAPYSIAEPAYSQIFSGAAEVLGYDFVRGFWASARCQIPVGTVVTTLVAGTAGSPTDYTVNANVEGLESGTVYYYRFQTTDASVISNVPSSRLRPIRQLTFPRLRKPWRARGDSTFSSRIVKANVNG